MHRTAWRLNWMMSFVEGWIEAMRKSYRLHLHSLSTQILSSVAAMLVATAGVCAADGVAGVQGEPVLRLDAGGPTTFVTSLAWSPNGDTLYHAGYDKVVHVWRRDSTNGRFAVQSNATYRVPVGPGQLGAINAIAVSDDGKLLAVGGLGTFRRQAGFRDAGFIIPSSELTDDMLSDRGVIYVFDTTTRQITTLRGHKGAISALAFAPGIEGKSATLVSAAFETERGSGKRFGSVRAWDVATTRPIAERSIAITIGSSIRPTVATRARADGAIDIAVAGFQNGVVLFDTVRGQDSTFRFGEGVCNGAVAFVPSEDSIVIGFSDKLGKWSLDGIQRGEQTPQAEYPFDKQALPVAVGFVGKRADRPREFVCVSRVLGENLVNRLTIHAVTDLKPVAESRVLWPNNNRTPTLVCSPSSSRFAVAGRSEHSVDILDSAEIVAGRDSMVKLSGVGVGFRTADFVHRGEHNGIRFASPEGSWVLDIADRKLAAQVDGWESANVAADAWKFKQRRMENSPGGPPVAVFEFVDANDRLAAIRPGVNSVMAFAVLPATAPRRGLIALSYVRETEPILGIFDLETGAMLRQLTSHTLAPSSMRFSADGRLLISTADDQTACVWSLVDVDEVLGKRGRPMGIEVGEQQGEIVVLKVNPSEGGFAAGQWLPGDIISETFDGSKSMRLKKVDEYYAAFMSNKPGAKVRATRLRNGEAPSMVDIPVGQGIDEQKPLFSLFVGRTGDSEAMSWIGWSPMGPFDCSGAEVESRLGWHFNTNNATAPTAFANVEQLRKDFYRQGLLARLMREGRWRPEVIAPPAAPTLTIWLKDARRQRLELGGAKWPLLRSNQATLCLALSSFPVEFIGSARIRVDDGPAKPMQPSSELQWAVSLAEENLSRGLHRVTVVVGTNESPAREFTTAANLEYFPAAPMLELPGIADQVVVEADDFSLPVRVKQPDLSIADTSLVIEHRAGGKVIQTLREKMAGGAAGKEIGARLKLAMGVNSVVVRVVNDGALNDGAELETAVREITVVNNRQPVPPPRIGALVVTATGESADAFVAANDQQHAVVASMEIRLRGKIEAKEELAEARVGIEEMRSVKIDDNRATTIALDETIALQPGRQRIVVRARTKTSEWSEASVTVDCQPAAPSATIVEPVERRTFVKSRDATRIRVLAKFDAGKNWQQFTATLLRNGKAVQEAVEVDVAKGMVAAAYSLEPGEQTLQFQFSNRWGGKSNSTPCTVRLNRPPLLLSVEGPATTDKPVVTMTVGAQSELPELAFSVNGRLVNATKAPNQLAGSTTATYRLDGLTLAEGENRLEVSVRNADGPATETKVATVRFARPIERPAAATTAFLDPAVDGVAGAVRQKIRFRVKSVAPVRQIRLTQKTARGEATIFQSDKVLDSTASGQDFAVEVTIAKGTNEFELTTINDGGETRKRVALTGAFAPARVVIDRVEPADKPETPVAFKLEANNRIAFTEAAPAAKLRLRGRIVWTDAADARIDELCTVKVVVNGFEQLPVAAAPREPGKGERRFSADLVLHLEKENRVRLAPAGFGLDAASQTDLSLDCTKPATDRDVYVVGFAPWSAGEGKLLDRILKAFQASSASQVTGACVFGKLRRVEILAGEKARLDTLQGRLGMIQEELVEQRDSNAIVLIYYEGKEQPFTGKSASTETALGYRLLTYESEYQDNLELSSITDRELRQRFSSTPGAHILLLDVVRESLAAADKKEESAQDVDVPRNTEIAMVRLVRLTSEAIEPKVRLLPLLDGAFKLKDVERLGQVSLQIRNQITALIGAEAGNRSLQIRIPAEMERTPLRGQ